MTVELNRLVNEEKHDCRCPCTCGHAHDHNLPALCIFCRALATYQESQRGEPLRDLRQLACDIRRTNHNNGFDQPTWDNLPVKVMFVVTELNEGLDAIKGTGDDPLIEELADAAIRILDILTSCFGETWADRTVDLYDRTFEGGLFEPGEVALWRVLKPLCGAVEDWRYERVGDVRIGLEIALREVFTMALLLGVELRTVIVWKNERNSRRGIRHGKSRSEG